MPRSIHSTGLMNCCSNCSLCRNFFVVVGKNSKLQYDDEGVVPAAIRELITANDPLLMQWIFFFWLASLAQIENWRERVCLHNLTNSNQGVETPMIQSLELVA
jgi:hypothetical protein